MENQSLVVVTDEKPISRKSGRGGARFPNAGGRQPGAGRPAYKPTRSQREQVERLAGFGLPLDQVAALVGEEGIHVDTLNKHFQKEIRQGRAKANSGVANTLYEKAMSGDTGAMIWWSKTQMRWAETAKIEHTGKGGGPIALAAVDFRGLSDSELDAMQELLSKAASAE